MSIRPKRPTFSHELKLFTIGAERIALLGDLVTEARADLRPRNFAERHLVDELAISKWRTYRVALMEKAVFEQQRTTFRPRVPRDSDGNMLMPHEDIYHLAMAHAPESHAVVLAALSRLDARYSRQFCAALRLLIALRRGDPPPVPEPRPDAAEPLTTNDTGKDARASRINQGKEEPTCEPSPTTQPTM